MNKVHEFELSLYRYLEESYPDLLLRLEQGLFEEEDVKAIQQALNSLRR